jgi:hypothetical protein
MDAHRPAAWRRTHLSYLSPFATEQLNARFSLLVEISFSLNAPPITSSRPKHLQAQTEYRLALEAPVALLAIALISSAPLSIPPFRE